MNLSRTMIRRSLVNVKIQDLDRKENVEITSSLSVVEIIGGREITGYEAEGTGRALIRRPIPQTGTYFCVKHFCAVGPVVNIFCSGLSSCLYF